MPNKQTQVHKIHLDIQGHIPYSFIFVLTSIIINIVVIINWLLKHLFSEILRMIPPRIYYISCICKNFQKFERENSQLKKNHFWNCSAFFLVLIFFSVYLFFNIKLIENENEKYVKVTIAPSYSKTHWSSNNSSYKICSSSNFNKIERFKRVFLLLQIMFFFIRRRPVCLVEKD